MLTILQLEDDKSICQIFKTALIRTESDIQLYQFENSDVAMTFIEEQFATIDLFVLDINLPGSLNGTDVAQNIRGLDCHAPIIITSAYAHRIMSSSPPIAVSGRRNPGISWIY